MRGALRYAKFAIAGIAILFSLSGCLLGNGEGYGFKGGSSDGDFTPGPGMPSTTAAVYYWLDPSYTCVDPISGNVIHSFRQSIRVLGQAAYQLGDRCNATQTEIPYTDLTFSSSYQFAGYQNGIYTYFESFPTQANIDGTRSVEAWCRTADLTSDTIYDVTFRSPANSNDHLYAQIHQKKNSDVILQSQVNDLYLPVDRAQGGNFRDYDGESFHLNITLPSPGFLYDGSVDASIEGTNVNQALSCRVLFY